MGLALPICAGAGAGEGGQFVARRTPLIVRYDSEENDDQESDLDEELFGKNDTKEIDWVEIGKQLTLAYVRSPHKFAYSKEKTWKMYRVHERKTKMLARREAAIYAEGGFYGRLDAAQKRALEEKQEDGTKTAPAATFTKSEKDKQMERVADMQAQEIVKNMNLQGKTKEHRLKNTVNNTTNCWSGSVH